MKQDKIIELYKDCSGLITEKTQEIHQLVLGEGDCDADIIFIGDMPSTEEEAAGAPFIGKSARTLSRCLEVMGLKKEQVYVTHLIKYHPYKVNERTGRIVARTPKKDEISFFLSYLIQEIDIISPKIIVTLGSLPLKTLMEDNSLQIKSEHGKVRKKVINNHSYTILPISQPALASYSDEEIDNEDIVVLKQLVRYVAEHDKDDTQIPENYYIEPKKNNMSPEPTLKQEAPKNNDGKLKVIVIYGGDGYADDPTLVALDRIGNVLNELNTRIIRLDLYKEEYSIKSFINELSSSQAVVIATTVEWIGVGGYLQLFLDKCWKYGTKTAFDGIYLFGVIISKQGYERDAYNHLIKSWELLGGLQGSDICACIKKSIDLETNQTLLNAIDKKTEEFYRIAHQGRVILPTSIRENKIYIEVPVEKYINFPEGAVQREHEANETLIPNYETFIEKQQKDIEDIAGILKKKISHHTEHSKKTVPQIFNEGFLGSNEPFECKIQWYVNENAGKNFVMDIKTKKINTSFGNVDDCTIVINLDEVVLHKIIEGKMTIQRAFLTGEIKAKGDFTVLYKLDALFNFKKK